MKYSLDYLPIAREDIAEISFYISDALQNPSAAMALLNQLDKAIGRLSGFPHAYRAYRPAEPLETEYRVMPIKNYLVFYTVSEAERRVEIHRIIYSKMDLPEIIK